MEKIRYSMRERENRALFIRGLKNGLPIGLQLMGPHFSEDVLFNAADHFENLRLFERRGML